MRRTRARRARGIALSALVLGLAPGARAGSDAAPVQVAIPVRVVEGAQLSDLGVDLSVLLRDAPGVQKAKPDAAGNLGVRVVPSETWSPAAASAGGVPIVPADAILRLDLRYGPDATPVQQVIGLLDGKVVTPQRVVGEWIAPFHGLCHAALGATPRLGPREAVSFEVPAGRSALDALLAKPQLAGARWFALPAELGGFQVSAPADAATRSWLEGLAQGGTIAHLGADPCRQFLPNGGGSGCDAPDVPWLEKAQTLSGGYQGSLSYAGGAVSDGLVLVAPFSGSPWYTPVWDDAAARGPQLGRTDGSGAFSVPLGDLGGPVEVAVASGCETKSAVAIAGGASSAVAEGTQVRPPSRPAPSPPPPPPPAASFPKPPEGARICGPDVTDYVLGTLQLLSETFSQYDETMKDTQCAMLYGRRFNAAWDMQYFAPSDGEDDMKYIFFQRAAPDACAIPRHPCGATVEFFGRCMNAQVVNYAMYGLINQLCDNQDVGYLAHWARDTLGAVFSLRTKGVNWVGQDAMTHVGEYFGKTHTGLPEKKAVLKHLLDIHQQAAGADWDAMPGTDCALPCTRYADPKPFLENLAWGFQWGDDVPTRRGFQMQKLPPVAK